MYACMHIHTSLTCSICRPVSFQVLGDCFQRCYTAAQGRLERVLRAQVGFGTLWFPKAPCSHIVHT